MIAVVKATTELQGAQKVARSWSQVVEHASKGVVVTITDPKTGKQFELRLKEGEA